MAMLIACPTACTAQQIKLPAIPTLLKDEALAKRADEMRAVKMRIVTESELTLFGLIRCVNQRLSEEGGKLRINLEPAIKNDVSVEEALRGNVFSEHFKALGRLDSRDLANQISNSSVFDVLYNLRDLCLVTIGWFPTGFVINHGDNTPLERGVPYRVKFIK